MNMNARLCFVTDAFAYFTTREPFSEQWGDDWDDAPYEHNAGEPYGWHPRDAERGIPPYEIVKVAWEGDLETPAFSHMNSPYSVEQINAGQIAWLRSWYRGQMPAAIMAGCTLADFIEQIEACGGTVYLPREVAT